MTKKIIFVAIIAAIFGLGALTYFGVIHPDSQPVVTKAE